MNPVLSMIDELIDERFAHLSSDGLAFCTFAFLLKILHFNIYRVLKTSLGLFFGRKIFHCLLRVLQCTIIELELQLRLCQFRNGTLKIVTHFRPIQFQCGMPLRLLPFVEVTEIDMAIRGHSHLFIALLSMGGSLIVTALTLATLALGANVGAPILHEACVAVVPDTHGEC